MVTLLLARTRKNRSMDSEAALPRVVDSASGALQSRAMVPSAMLIAGVFQVQVVAALALLFCGKIPEGIFSHHGKAAVFVYYAVLMGRVIVGSATATASFWVAHCLDGQQLEFLLYKTCAHEVCRCLYCIRNDNLGLLRLRFRLWLKPSSSILKV